MTQGNFLIDTSIWVDLFKGSDRAKRKVLPLIQQGSAYICGVVVYELMAGIKRPEQRKDLLTSLDVLNYLEMDRASWAQAAEMFHELRAKGIILPFSDIILACLAQKHDCQVLTRDRHFSYIKGLKIRSIETRSES